ncbi:MAG: hypothetical protein ACOCVG_04735 [Verrucomicrobiota bacterium]
MILIAVMGGCRTVPPEKIGKADPAGAQGDEPVVQVSPNADLGMLVEVNLPVEVAVMELSPGTRQVPEILVARDAALRPTAVLQRTRHISGRAIGLKILAGQPQTGQRLVQPASPALQELVAQALGQQPTPSQSSPATAPTQEEALLDSIRLR